jgi:hypothetical protein
MCSGDTHDVNIATVTALAAQAARQGAELLCLPEVAGLMNRNGEIARHAGGRGRGGPLHRRLPGPCRETRALDPYRLHPRSRPRWRFLNHSAVIDDDRQRSARPMTRCISSTWRSKGRRRSANPGASRPGEAAVILDTPWGPGACRSATTCASPISTAATDRKASASSSSPRPSPCPRVAPIGRS